MNPTDFLLKMFEARAKAKDDSRDFTHWLNHCVNCGTKEGNLHNRSDCPPQNYEVMSDEERYRRRVLCGVIKEQPDA